MKSFPKFDESYFSRENFVHNSDLMFVCDDKLSGKEIPYDLPLVYLIFKFAVGCMECSNGNLKLLCDLDGYIVWTEISRYVLEYIQNLPQTYQDRFNKWLTD